MTNSFDSSPDGSSPSGNAKTAQEKKARIRVESTMYVLEEVQPLPVPVAALVLKKNLSGFSILPAKRDPPRPGAGERADPEKSLEAIEQAGSKPEAKREDNVELSVYRNTRLNEGFMIVVEKGSCPALDELIVQYTAGMETLLRLQEQEEDKPVQAMRTLWVFPQAHFTRTFDLTDMDYARKHLDPSSYKLAQEFSLKVITLNPDDFQGLA